uniref:Uncharacterized protein n=1 Tax=Romanomermis culicivorax TaxID=13658 RepID=A0A915L5T6_ROMCU
MFPKKLSSVSYFLLIIYFVKASHDLINDSSVDETSANSFGNSQTVSAKRQEVSTNKFFQPSSTIELSDDSTERKRRRKTSRKVEKRTTMTPIQLENDVENENDHEDDETETTIWKSKSTRKRIIKRRTTKTPKRLDVNKFGELIDALDTRRESAKRLLAALSDLLNRVDDDTKVKIDLN